MRSLQGIKVTTLYYGESAVFYAIMHIKGKDNWIKHADFIGLNLLALVLSFMLAYYFRFGNMNFILSPSWRSMLAILCLINLVMNFMLSPHSGIFRRTYYEDALKCLQVTIYTFIIVAILLYLFKVGALYSRITLVSTFILYFFFSTVFTFIRKSRVLSGKVKNMVNRERQMFVVTTKDNVEETVKNLYASDIKEYDIAGYSFTDDEGGNGKYDGKPVIPLKDVSGFIVTEHIDDVFVAVDPQFIRTEDYRAMVDNGVTVHLDIEAMIGIETDNQFISNVGVYKTASVGEYTFDARRVAFLIIKRFLDIVFGLIGCVLLAFITIVVKISYLITGDTHPIFYSQTRVGQYGKPFRMFKFRTMVPNADLILEELLKDDDYREEWETSQKIENDPRITRVGHILRRTSLDEFPQFINVLKGEMSIVGPRPLVEGELEEHGGLTLYNKIKPGITGWWGCNGRSNIDYRERLELEYYYVKNCSLYLDILCIVRSAWAVIRRDGAH